jgi:hypothetical protein
MESVGEAGECRRSRDFAARCSVARPTVGAPVIGINRCSAMPRVRKNYVKVWLSVIP